MLMLSLIVIVNATLGLFVLLRNTRSTVNRLFFLVTLSVILWSVSSYLTDHAAHDQRAVWASLAFVFPVFLLFSLALLSHYFPVRLGISHFSKSVLSLIFLVSAAVCASPLVVDDITIRPDGGTTIIPGPLYFIFIATILFFLGYAVRGYYLSLGKSNVTQKIQAKLVGTGFIIGFAWGILCNGILPLVFSSLGTERFGPAGTIFFVAFTAYAIIRHKLFNIQLVIARFVAYVLLISALASLYGLSIFIFADEVFSGSELLQRTTPFLAALFVAFTAGYLKKFFDRFTNSIFFRDSYDPQTFLDHLNKTIITNIELGILLRRTASVIEEHLKSEYAVFGIYSNQDLTYRVIGTQSKVYTPSELKVISEGFVSLKVRAVSADDLDHDHVRMQEILIKNDIAVAVRLSSTLDHENHTTGYLFLGRKKSGNTYSDQDMRIIKIVADELVIAIQNSLRFEEIQQFNVTLQNRINQATTKVKRTNDKLQVLDQTKDEFISMASHQLRTPLTSMKGYISMVLDGDAGPVTDAQRKMLQQAYISSQRMTYLISDLLNVSRLRSGKFVMDTSTVNLANVVAQEVEQLQESAKARSLNLHFDAPKDFPEIELDETKIRQVIMNFLDNAIYYSPDGGDVEIELKEKARNIEFTVKDAGIGVPKSLQHHLFTKFYRAPNAKLIRPDGTGLGLYMAKKVVVGQGGAVIFRSHENEGSTFGFTFPKK